MMNTNPTSMGVSPNCGTHNLNIRINTHTVCKKPVIGWAIRTYTWAHNPKFSAPLCQNRLLAQDCLYYIHTRRVCSNKYMYKSAYYKCIFSKQFLTKKENFPATIICFCFGEYVYFDDNLAALTVTRNRLGLKVNEVLLK